MSDHFPPLISYESPIRGFVTADLDPAWRPAYERELHRLWGELLHISSALKITQRIRDFPFEKIHVRKGLFWQTTERSLMETIVMGLWRVLVDKRRDVLTLNHLKADVVAHMRPEKQQPFAAALDEIEFGQRTRVAQRHLLKVRHTFVAHYARDPAQGASVPVLTFDQLIEIKEETRTLLAVLAFEQGLSPDWPEYSPLLHPQGPLDVDILLATLARSSLWLSFPERDPYTWAEHLRQMPPEEAEEFQRLRAQFGFSNT